MKVTSAKDIGGTDILGFKSIPDGSSKAPGGGSSDSEVVGM